MKIKRRNFIQSAAVLGAAAYINPAQLFGKDNFPMVRVPESERRFKSASIEAAIAEFQKKVKDQELGWLFGNCFPNTLDTTVTYSETDGRPDTYVITGDIDAMWLRDSSAQVWPYMAFVEEDEGLKNLIAGVINRQTSYLLIDPYANAFYNDPDKRGEWASDYTDMKPGVHERKWEIDSLCYPIRLAYHYWKSTGDTAPFDQEWKKAIVSILTVFKEQQLKEGRGSYHFERQTPRGSDTRALSGYGYPVNPVGLIASAFRPSDDATVFSFLIPSNFFAVVSLNQAAEMCESIHRDSTLADQLRDLSNEVSEALKKYATVNHSKYGQIYAYEVDGFGSQVLMDDANVPSLLSLPYLGAMDVKDETYQRTRQFLLSADNPFFFEGKAGKGIGGPHAGMDMIWPMAITMQGLTSTSDQEIKDCIQMLKSTHADTGFMHETFHKDNPQNFTRSWFAWANTLFGEFLWKTYQERPELFKK